MYDGSLHTSKMPKHANELRKYLQFCIATYGKVCVFIEKLSIQHRDFYEAGKVFRLQKMMENYSQLKAIIDVCNCDYAEVHPLTWQSRLGLRKRGEEKQERKARYKTEAQKFYPLLKATLWNCDAVLIMHFGRSVLQKISRKDKKWLNDNLNRVYNQDLF
jgi:hypothetical protein